MLSKLTLCFFAFFVFDISIVSAGVHENSAVHDTEKPYYIADILVKNPHLAKQIWDIGLAAATMQSTDSGSSSSSLDSETKFKMYNYILDNLPLLLKNDVFENILHDVVDEILIAYNESDVSKNVTAFQTENRTFTNAAATDVFNHLDLVRLLQRSIESGKPVIDVMRGNDSTVFIAAVKHLIEMAPVFWKNPSFQKTKACQTENGTFTNVVSETISQDDQLESMRLAAESRVTLNIGGTKFETSRLTLMNVPGSILSNMVKTESVFKPLNSVFFIDRDPSHFHLVLNYMRNAQTFSKTLLPRERRYLEELKIESKFYKLSKLTKMIQERIEYM